MARPWNVYVLCEEGAEDTGPCKIGTACNVKYRVDSIRCGNWRRLILIGQFAVDDQCTAIAIERAVLSQFEDLRIPTRDWLHASPRLVAQRVQDILGRRK